MMAITKSPVLLIVFNRPEKTRLALEAIRQAKPSRLYIASDGPRKDHVSDHENVSAVRSMISSISWQYPIRTFYRDKNAGCKRAVSEAIDWFFQYEEFGIILEDDIMPNQTFFRFMDLALAKYENNPLVGMITGHAVNSSITKEELRVRFSHYALVWGWATWRKVWLLYDSNLKHWDNSNQGFLKNYRHSSRLFVEMWANIFDSVKMGRVDTWDYQLNYLLMSHGLYCVAPPCSLIQNIGFDHQATHTTGRRPLWASSSRELDADKIKLTAPKHSINYDKLIGKEIFGITYVSRVKHMLKRLLKPCWVT
jgi:hypothetical protein